MLMTKAMQQMALIEMIKMIVMSESDCPYYLLKFVIFMRCTFLYYWKVKKTKQQQQKTTKTKRATSLHLGKLSVCPVIALFFFSFCIWQNKKNGDQLLNCGCVKTLNFW